MADPNPPTNMRPLQLPTPSPPSHPPVPPSSLPSTTTMTSSSSQSHAGRHAKYHGIRCRSGKWVSEIRQPRQTTRIWLGTFPTPEMAAAAYDVAALALKGNEATLNFPNYVQWYPVPLSLSPKDVRTAAATAAAALRVKSENVGNFTTQMTSREEEFIDEEALFDMPNLLLNMAEGLLLDPPRINSPESDDAPESDAESLWSYF